ncbi:MOB kinase activator 3B-like [Sinocyclocheilus anshuiensis]|uniref:MOB kinase activator 3B-like n=1 Tax=Sinocyclocheilus anshuiensis TaxID=1608454 RepID=UPI0007BA33AB|nr:PREDICTED: MOB kinase activator 3B-like [Sinocyclocheilus anshuiensis]
MRGVCSTSSSSVTSSLFFYIHSSSLCFGLSGIPFPKNFIQICKKILCRLFRVFVHVYIHHFDRILLMGAEAHVNTCYKHFYYFSTELNLIECKELEPLKEMTSRMCL